MKLHKVTTLVQFKHTYWIEAEELEHAFDEIVMRDAYSCDDSRYFDESSQEFIGETIIDGETLKYKHFANWLEREKNKKENWVSHWLGDKLIHKVNYDIPEAPTPSPAFAAMTASLIGGRPDVE